VGLSYNRQLTSQLTYAGTYGMTNYDALILSLEKRVASGLTFLAGFSWQKSLDLPSNAAFEGNLGVLIRMAPSCLNEQPAQARNRLKRPVSTRNSLPDC
jgi:hypothetical protein